jgi:hypothetical protein
MSTVLTILGTYVAPGVLAAIAALAVIAPLTKTNKDNLVLAGLRWFERVVLGVLLPGRAAPAKLVAPPAAKETK